MALTPKLKKLPIVMPLIMLNSAMFAAVSTWSFRSLGLCSNDGAAIMPSVAVYPSDIPNAAKIRKYRMSELTKGDDDDDPCPGRWMLQSKSNGMKAVRASEMYSIFREDHIVNRGYEQRLVPSHPEALCKRKWKGMNRGGEKKRELDGVQLTEPMEIVIAGHTAIETTYT